MNDKMKKVSSLGIVGLALLALGLTGVNNHVDDSSDVMEAKSVEMVDEDVFSEEDYDRMVFFNDIQEDEHQRLMKDKNQLEQAKIDKNEADRQAEIKLAEEARLEEEKRVAEENRIKEAERVAQAEREAETQAEAQAQTTTASNSGSQGSSQTSTQPAATQKSTPAPAPAPAPKPAPKPSQPKVNNSSNTSNNNTTTKPSKPSTSQPETKPVSYPANSVTVGNHSITWVYWKNVTGSAWWEGSESAATGVQDAVDKEANHWVNIMTQDNLFSINGSNNLWVAAHNYNSPGKQIYHIPKEVIITDRHGVSATYTYIDRAKTYNYIGTGTYGSNDVFIQTSRPDGVNILHYRLSKRLN